VTVEQNGEQGSPLRRARLRKDIKQARAIALFVNALERQGKSAPSRESLKRQFAYWESGERLVTIEAYKRAFMEIYEAPAEALGFATSPPRKADDVAAELATVQSFRLFQVDRGLVDLFESQTHNLRLLDRRLGAETLAVQAKAHVDQVSNAFRRSVTGPRHLLGACLAEAAALAGWQALDGQDLGRAWDMHELARSAAREAGDVGVTAHVTAQQSCVLLDHGQAELALQLATSASRIARNKVPPLLAAWLAAAEAEAFAATGNEVATLRKLDAAARLLDRADGGDELPYLMLSAGHLARWRGHCLARLGHTEAIEYLTTALSAAGDSVRAATGLHADLAIAFHHAGQLGGARQHAVIAASMASQFGSARQRRRLRQVLAASDG
jgi:tetratricopeptide (TPR) repeat protein